MIVKPDSLSSAFVFGCMRAFGLGRENGMRASRLQGTISFPAQYPGPGMIPDDSA